jgi:NADH/F420H2 dehydrogenase subunit C
MKGLKELYKELVLIDEGVVITARGDQEKSLGDEVIVNINSCEIIKVLEYLKDEWEFNMLVDMTAVDYIERSERFVVVYNLLSIKWGRRLRVKVSTSEMQSVKTITGVYKNADWLEREIYDMFGVEFDGHPDLRRILTDYGFEGHPLRKDYPLVGYYDVRYDEARKQMVTTPIELVQEYRKFTGINPWVGKNK